MLLTAGTFFHGNGIYERMKFTDWCITQPKDLTWCQTSAWRISVVCLLQITKDVCNKVDQTNEANEIQTAAHVFDCIDVNGGLFCWFFDSDSRIP